MSEILVCRQCQSSLRYTPQPQARKSLCPKCRAELVIPAMRPMQEQSIVTPNAAVRPIAAAPPPRQDFSPPAPQPLNAAPLPANSYDDPKPRYREDEPRRSRRDEGANERRPRDSYDDDRRRPERDWDDDYDQPRRVKKGSSRGLIIGLSIGGGLLLVGGVVVLLIVLLGGGGNPLVGRWRPADMPAGFGLDFTLEFTSGGELIINAGPMSTRARYKTIDGNSLEIEGAFGGMPFGGPGMGRGRQFYRIEGDTLILSDRPGGFGVRLRRA